MINKPPQKPTTATTTATKSETALVTTAVNEPTQTKDIVPNVATIADADLNAMLKVLRTEVRRREKERESLRPKIGSQVKVLRGRPKYVGKVGTAIIVRKSRCFVTVPGINSPAYVLITDVELVATEH